MNLILALLLLSTGSLEVIHPIPDATITDRTPEFIWKGDAHTIMIDDNPDFTSSYEWPVGAHSFLMPHELPLGKNYWKLIGPKDEITASFTIDSIIAVQRTKSEDEIQLINVGNTPVEITTSPSMITGAMVLDQNHTAAFPLRKFIEIMIGQP